MQLSYLKITTFQVLRRTAGLNDLILDMVVGSQTWTDNLCMRATVVSEDLTSSSSSHTITKFSCLDKCTGGDQAPCHGHGKPESSAFKRHGYWLGSSCPYSQAQCGSPPWSLTGYPCISAHVGRNLQLSTSRSVGLCLSIFRKYAQI
jgi:hypothetical protein